MGKREVALLLIERGANIAAKDNVGILLVCEIDLILYMYHSMDIHQFIQHVHMVTEK